MRLHFPYIYGIYTINIYIYKTLTTVYRVDFLLWNLKCKKENINCKVFLSGFYIFATFLAQQRNCIGKTFSFFWFYSGNEINPLFIVCCVFFVT